MDGGGGGVGGEDCDEVMVGEEEARAWEREEKGC